jgi:hypothetical protein
MLQPPARLLACSALFALPLVQPPFQSSYSPPFHGAPCTQFSGWESFTQASGGANAPDDPNSTTTNSAVIQTVAGGVITAQGNIDHLTQPPHYLVTETAPADVQEVVLQVSILLNQVNWSNVTLSYIGPGGMIHSLSPTNSQYLVFQMGHEERLLSWDLSGVADTVLAYQVDIAATNSFTTLDAVKLDSRYACCGIATNYCTAGVTTHGCSPSIAASGNPSASASSGFVLTITAVEGQKQGIIFYGISGQQALPWTSGSTSFLCVKSPTQRTGPHNSGGTVDQCDGVLNIDWLAYLASHPNALGQPFSAGDVVQAQGWFRDPPAPKTTNLSNALEFTLCP